MRRRSKARKQTIALGPVASQEAIKQLGTNGGGFFNANAAHPFENPSHWSNMLSIFAMLVLSAALPFMFGRMVGDGRQGRALFIAMFLFLLAGVAVVYWAEAAGNPIMTALGVDPADGQHGGQGGPLRPRPVGALRGGDHRPLLRRRQRHACLADAARRPGAAVR